ncbi:MAG: hypothetical protein DRN30_04585, partial [Thermoplasmata archaeon]
YAKKLDWMFHKFANSDEYKSESWLTCMEKFVSEYLKLPDYAWYTVNTYNYDNILSQVLQYTIFNLKGESEFYEDCYVIMQTHNGCDVRGGYSTPHVFRVIDWEYFVMAQHEIYAKCSKCGVNWISDDSGYHWYNDNWDTADIGNEWLFDSELNKVFHKDCGGEIVFDVLHTF